MKGTLAAILMIAAIFVMSQVKTVNGLFLIGAILISAALYLFLSMIYEDRK